MSSAKLFLIDAHALCYRSYYAIKGLSTSKGQATNAVYGFIGTLRKIIKDFNPEYIAVCFDVGKKTHRQVKFAEYKIQRPVMPNDLISQIPIIKEVIAAYNLATFELEGFEADDVIATLAHDLPGKDLDVVIVSDDKDMLQLINDHVKVYSIRQEKILGYEEAKERLGIEPKYIKDLIGLAGDPVDNIPGVFGIGEVTAKNLINKFGTLENILKNIDKVEPVKVREKIIENKKMAILSKELSQLDMNVPIEFNLEQLKVKGPDQNRLWNLFQELEFRKFAQELSGADTQAEKLEIKYLKAEKDVASLIAGIKKEGYFSFLMETPEEGELIQEFKMGIALEGETIYELGEGKFSALKDVFEDKQIVKVTHDVKNAMKALGETQLAVKGRIFDVMLAGYLLAPSQGAYDLDTLAWNYLKSSIPAEQKLAGGVSAISKMFNKLLAELKKKSLLKLFEEVEIPLAYVLYRLETNGLKLDTALLKKLSKECEGKLKELETKIFKMAGCNLNINSPKQLSQVLFEKLKLPVVKKTKTGFSTDEGVLTKLAVQHPLPALILDFRQYMKLKSTYIDALPQLIDPKTGRLHGIINQTGTETGRLSSNNPNLQNIPIRTDLGRQVRRAFIATGKDHVLIAADYSQIELRILAHFSKDKTLMEAFENDHDIHRYTASLIYEVDEKDVTYKMRDSAKRINFGINYGMSAFGLSKDLNISVQEAQDFIDKYFLRYPGVKKFMDETIKSCEKEGYVTTLLQRRRYIPEIHSDNINIRQFAQRQAINTPIQGSAADLIKLAMINIQRELEKGKFTLKMILTIHDELVFDVPKAEEKRAIDFIREQMESPLKLSVPIKVTVKVGVNWLEMEEIEVGSQK
ncbi:MAG: DNA polymerase I [Omnitrophica WOR_2 bacterium GWA2_47_8]|nr:MAG: DNA polymerase I [Omnitrophica WOR_2 bacterium GWA2_47_8]